MLSAVECTVGYSLAKRVRALSDSPPPTSPSAGLAARELSQLFDLFPLKQGLLRLFPSFPAGDVILSHDATSRLVNVTLLAQHEEPAAILRSLGTPSSLLAELTDALNGSYVLTMPRPPTNVLIILFAPSSPPEAPLTPSSPPALPLGGQVVVLPDSDITAAGDRSELSGGLAITPPARGAHGRNIVGEAPGCIGFRVKEGCHITLLH